MGHKYAYRPNCDQSMALFAKRLAILENQLTEAQQAIEHLKHHKANRRKASSKK